jgi:hypothetical protein
MLLRLGPAPFPPKQRRCVSLACQLASISAKVSTAGVPSELFFRFRVPQVDNGSGSCDRIGRRPGIASYFSGAGLSIFRPTELPDRSASALHDYNREMRSAQETRTTHSVRLTSNGPHTEMDAAHSNYPFPLRSVSSPLLCVAPLHILAHVQKNLQIEALCPLALTVRLPSPRILTVPSEHALSILL